MVTSQREVVTELSTLTLPLLSTELRTHLHCDRVVCCSCADLDLHAEAGRGVDWDLQDGQQLSSNQYQHHQHMREGSPWKAGPCFEQAWCKDIPSFSVQLDVIYIQFAALFGNYLLVLIHAEHDLR